MIVGTMNSIVRCFQVTGARCARLATLDPDLPLMLEHWPREEYPSAAAFIPGQATTFGFNITEG